MEIKYIDYGIGNRVGNTIFLNKNLKKYPALYNAVLDHEKKHSGNYSKKDFLLDFHNRELRGVKGEYFRFILENPRSWINFFPIIKLGNKWCIDISLTLFWLIMASFFIFIFLFLK